ncbi:hypothetical protein ACOSQ2_009421 [Xanthoceras sorbifolium]
MPSRFTSFASTAVIWTATTRPREDLSSGRRILPPHRSTTTTTGAKVHRLTTTSNKPFSIDHQNNRDVNETGLAEGGAAQQPPVVVPTQHEINIGSKEFSFDKRSSI